MKVSDEAGTMSGEETAAALAALDEQIAEQDRATQVDSARLVVSIAATYTARELDHEHRFPWPSLVCEYPISGDALAAYKQRMARG